jgi:hypothetical protein
MLHPLLCSTPELKFFLGPDAVTLLLGALSFKFSGLFLGASSRSGAS